MPSRYSSYKIAMCCDVIITHLGYSTHISFNFDSARKLTGYLACGEWCGWSQCDSECGPGEQTRVRTCPDCPDCEVAQERECPEEEQNECAPEPTCGWTEWCNWSDCDADCADGKRARSRLCDCGDQPACATQEQDCPGSNLEEEPCNQV